MSDHCAAATRPATPSWLALLGERGGGFTPDLRFSGEILRPAVDPAAAAEAAEADIERALGEAFASGLAQGRAEAAQLLAAECAAQERLRLSVTRVDEALQRTIADRLAETVAALCEGALAPLAADSEALQRRCLAAARLLGEAQEKLELHLHPEDAARLDPDFAAGWKIVPRADFERGTLRLEGAEAGAIDGPAEWRAALEAALSC